MKFSFFTELEGKAAVTRVIQAVKDALENAQGKISQGANLEFVALGGETTNKPELRRVDFDLRAEDGVDADAAIDVIEAVDGVTRAVYRVKGLNVRATVTGPHKKIRLKS